MDDAQTAANPPVPMERKHVIRMVQANGPHQQNGPTQQPNGPALLQNGLAVPGDREGDDDLSTTTLSTIAVRAGDYASIVVALLKSVGYLDLRIDEMKPSLLEIGETSRETADLLDIHEDLLRKLASKEEQVAALLSRTEKISTEKQPKEAFVYDSMAKNLKEAWRGLQKQLMLRGYLLKETLTFYRLAEHHDKLVASISKTLSSPGRAENGEDATTFTKKTESLMNELIDTTAQIMDVGSSAISQIRTLGSISDNPDRAQETLSSCVVVERTMLRIASEWEQVEAMWKKERSKVPIKTITDELLMIEQWLTHAERRVKAVTEDGFRVLLDEGNSHKARLVQLSTNSSSPNDGPQIAHLSGRIEEFLHYVKTRMNRSQRIQAFFQSAQTALAITVCIVLLYQLFKWKQCKSSPY